MRRTLGIALIALGFLLGAYIASLDPVQVNWPLFAIMVLAGAVGVFFLRQARQRAAADQGLLSEARTVLTDSLGRIAAGLKDLQQQALPAHEARFEIDRRFRDDLFAFAEARESLARLYGLKAYAEVMSAFAAGERYLNRIWSASADGYEQEVRAYLSRATEQFAEAEMRLNRVMRDG